MARSSSWPAMYQSLSTFKLRSIGFITLTARSIRPKFEILDYLGLRGSILLPTSLTALRCTRSVLRPSWWPSTKSQSDQNLYNRFPSFPSFHFEEFRESAIAVFRKFVKTWWDDSHLVRPQLIFINWTSQAALTLPCEITISLFFWALFMGLLFRSIWKYEHWESTKRDLHSTVPSRIFGAQQAASDQSDFILDVWATWRE